MVLRFEAEEVTQSAEGMEDGDKRALLGGLVGSLDAVLPFLAAALEASFGRAAEAAAAGNASAAAAQGAVVSAALGAAPCMRAPLPAIPSAPSTQAARKQLMVFDSQPVCTSRPAKQKSKEDCQLEVAAGAVGGAPRPRAAGSGLLRLRLPAGHPCVCLVGSVPQAGRAARPPEAPGRKRRSDGNGVHGVGAAAAAGGQRAAARVRLPAGRPRLPPGRVRGAARPVPAQAGAGAAPPPAPAPCPAQAGPDRPSPPPPGPAQAGTGRPSPPPPCPAQAGTGRLHFLPHPLLYHALPCTRSRPPTLAQQSRSGQSSACQGATARRAAHADRLQCLRGPPQYLHGCVGLPGPPVRGA